MTWTGFWGGQFADVWNRFPAAMWERGAQVGPLTRSLNQAHEQTVSWGPRPRPCRAPNPRQRAMITAP